MMALFIGSKHTSIKVKYFVSEAHLKKITPAKIIKIEKCSFESRKLNNNNKKLFAKHFQNSFSHFQCVTEFF